MSHKSENSVSTGKLGESIASRYLAGKGYTIIESNYRKHHGEIDIIAKDSSTIVFVEVKTVTREMNSVLSVDVHRPEENVHKSKISIISKTAELYMLSNRMTNEWRIDVIAIEISKTKYQAKVRHIRNVYL